MPNYIDIALCALLLFGIVRGFLHGFIYELAMLGALLVCYFLGFKLAAIVAGFLAAHFHWHSAHLHHISFLIVWIGLTIGAWFIAKLLSGLADVVALGPLNKIAGAVFGGLKYAFALSLLLYFINKTHLLPQDMRAESKLYYPILKISGMVLPVFE